jgi:MinD-like ATPase involved in chromosome partitioning or flagellar assembly
MNKMRPAIFTSVFFLVLLFRTNSRKNGTPRVSAHYIVGQDGALVQQNLYMASGNEVNGKLPRILPKKFTHLVPKINESDYDYIIFDMPSITQTSVTSKLAGFMDIVLLVLESEKTNLDLVRQSTSLLLESRANVAAVLNKTRRYVPEWLHPEL